jgi:hypothetical protein
MGKLPYLLRISYESHVKSFLVNKEAAVAAGRILLRTAALVWSAFANIVLS